LSFANICNFSGALELFSNDCLKMRCQFLHQWDSGSLEQNLIHLLFHGHDFTLCCVCQVDFAPVRLGSDSDIHKVVVLVSVLPPARAGFQVLLSIHKRKSYFYIILFRDLSIFLTPSSTKRGKRQIREAASFKRKTDIL